MESYTTSMAHHRMQRTATLAQEVLERAKSRKLKWPQPLQWKIFQESGDEHSCLASTFASVAEHMEHITAECERYYRCMPPFQFKENEVAHIFRYHSKQTSQDLLNAFQDEENKSGPIVEEPGYPSTELSALIPRKNDSDPKDVLIEVSPGMHTVSVNSHDDTIKQTHLVEVQPGQTVNLTFDL